ncbi:MAG: transglycosylase SLT domain-containing protein, partial [Bacilli bacterium]|nr:transglycosylase SLT domain-containing protein [Bacilli bacterium]
MQVEKAVWVDSSISAYNFETGQMETVKITKEKLNNLETNIQIGSMILRSNMEANNYNIPLALQSYNFGPGNMNKVLKTCAELEHIDEASMRQNPTENSWLNYRAFLHTGDSKYVEHVFSYLGNDEVRVQKRNNETVKVALTNDHVLENTNNRT